MSNPFDTNHFQALYNAGALPQIRPPQPQVIHTHSVQTVIKEVPAYTPAQPVKLDVEGMNKMLNPLAHLQQPRPIQEQRLFFNDGAADAAYTLYNAYQLYICGAVQRWAAATKFSDEKTLNQIQKNFDIVKKHVQLITESDNPVDVSQHWADVRDNPRSLDSNINGSFEKRLQAITAAQHSMKSLDPLTCVYPQANLDESSVDTKPHE